VEGEGAIVDTGAPSEGHDSGGSAERAKSVQASDVVLYPVFMPKSSTHMRNSGLIVLHIRLKMFTDN
jgi:hypothetical protein